MIKITFKDGEVANWSTNEYQYEITSTESWIRIYPKFQHIQYPQYYYPIYEIAELYIDQDS